MNYFDYLNKLVTTNGTQYYRIDESSFNQQNTSNPFVDSNIKTNVNYYGASIFNKAQKTDVDNLDYDKLSKILAGEDNENKLNPLEFVLGKLLSIESVKEKADTIEKDGKLSVEELKQFIKTLINLDGNEDLTLEDFDKFFKDNNINIDEIYQNEIEQQQAQQTQTDTQDQVSDVQTPSYDDTDYSAPVAASEAVSSADPVSYTPTTNVDDSSSDTQVEEFKTLSELESDKKEIVKTVNEKRKAIEDIHLNKNENIKAADKKVKDAQNAYLKALNKDEAAKAFKEDIIKNIKNIEKNQQNIDKNEKDIFNKENEIKDLNGKISETTSILDGLKTTLSAMKEPSDEKSKAEYNKQKTKLSKRIANLEKDLASQNAKLKTANEELKVLQQHKTTLEAEKTTLLETKEKLDKMVNEKCSQETKNALAAWNKAREDLNTVKSTELKKAQGELETAEKSLKEINEKIAVRKTQDEAMKYWSSGNVDISRIPEKYRNKNGVKETTLPDGRKILVCRWTHFDHISKEWLETTKYLEQAVKEAGADLVYGDMDRSCRTSDKQRAKKGNIVAPGGQSPHNYGCAADIAIFKNGKQLSVKSKEYKQIIDRAIELSGNKIESGIYWRKKGERHHVELRGWRQTHKNSKYRID